MAAKIVANMETTHVHAMQANISTDDSTTSLQKPRARAGAQPLEAAQDDDALLKISTFGALAGLSDSSVYRLIAAGELTAIKRGKRCTRLRAGQARAWLNAQGAGT